MAESPVALRIFPAERTYARNWLTSREYWVRTGSILMDVFFVLLNGVAVFQFRFAPEWFSNLLRGEHIDSAAYLPLHQYLSFLFLYVALVILTCHTQDLYRVQSFQTFQGESLSVLKAVTLATIFLTVVIYLSGANTISRLVVVSVWVLNIVMLAAWRLWRREVVARRVAEGIGVRNVLIVGTGRVGQELACYLEKNKHLGFIVKGFIDNGHKASPRVLGRIEDLRQIARAHFVDEIFITIPFEREIVKTIAFEARRGRFDVKLVPEIYDDLGWGGTFGHLGKFPIVALHTEPFPMLALLIKRMMDIVLSSFALVCFLPLMSLVALVIKLDSSGPVFYKAPRVGKKGRKFICYKFRSMKTNADELKGELRQVNERQGPFFKMTKDPRVTRTGEILRKYSVDELPQLWNVLKGDMSLVGPRPHPLDDYDQYRLEDLRRLDVAPGITGLWQVHARQNPSFEQNMAFDLEYIESWNFWLDLKILIKTLPVVLRGSGS